MSTNDTDDFWNRSTFYLFIFCYGKFNRPASNSNHRTECRVSQFFGIQAKEIILHADIHYAIAQTK